MVAFRDFLSGQLALTGDAISYYNHIKFYVENISRGVYPLWDPLWNSGVPNSFFLRRIGEFNPFLNIIIFFKTFGLIFWLSYLIFLAAYYFIGMIGFYKLARTLLGDKYVAFPAYLLLMFSSLATVLFDSFLMLLFVPIVWFFYFLVIFTQKPKKFSLLGMTFSLMIILTTYLPFYFLTIFLAFSLCFIILYFQYLKSIFLKYVEFIRKNKGFTCFCILLLVLSLLPGLLFYQQKTDGQTVLPIRQGQSTAENIIEVAPQTTIQGGIIATNIIKELFSNFSKFRLGFFYIPVFAFVLFLLGAVIPINRQLILLSLLGFGVYVISVFNATPVYQFLYDHIFYFKYIRSFQYFLWLVLLPVFILICARHLKEFLDRPLPVGREKYPISVFLVVIHGGLLFFLSQQKGMIWSSYVVVISSLIFFLSYSLGWLKNKKAMILVFFLILTIIQPMEVYTYLSKNSPKKTTPLHYEKPYMHFSFEGDGAKRELSDMGKYTNLPPLYFVTSWHNFLYQNIDNIVFERYIQHKFIAYDRVETFDEKSQNARRVEQAFMKNENVAFVADKGRLHESAQQTSVRGASKGRRSHNKAFPQQANSEQLRVLKYNMNSIKVKTNFPSRKFLVYNDSFHKGWRAFLNGKEMDIVRSNVAFKGVWLPAGENILYFRFGSVWAYGLGYFLIGVFNFVLIYLLVLWRKDAQKIGTNV